MDEQRKLLDSLMGIDRNKGKTAGDSPRFTEKDVCKFFLCGLCPYETFMNTVSKFEFFDILFRYYFDLYVHQKKKVNGHFFFNQHMEISIQFN
jgi:hypothetical protein